MQSNLQGHSTDKRMYRLPLLVTVLLCCGLVRCAWWSSTSKQSHAQEAIQEQNGPVARQRTPFETGMADPHETERARVLLDNLNKLKSSCWVSAYSTLFNSCRDMLKDEEKRMRLAYKFVDCFLRDSGKPALKPCSGTVNVKDCTTSLTDHQHQLLSSFFIDISSICYHLQSEAFTMETEQLIVDLKNSAHWVENTLESMQVQSKTILENTDRIFSSQKGLEQEVETIQQGLAQMHENIYEQMVSFKEYGEDASKHLEGIAQSQKVISEQQDKMAHQQQLLAANLEGDVTSLLSKTEDINTNVVKSLSGQEEFVMGLKAALSTLTHIKALQDNLHEKTKSLDEFHLRLGKGSESILKAQEEFSLKLAEVFTSLERLFVIHDAIRSESRAIKAPMFYIPVAVFIYLLTSTKQTNTARAILYFGLCISFGTEFYLVGVSHVNTLWIRGTYAILALSYIFYCIITFRDYAAMSYDMLFDLQKRLDKNISFLEPLNSQTTISEEFIEDSNSNSMSNHVPFKGYEDEYDRNRKDDDAEDPDYMPEEDSDSEDLRLVVNRVYDLRQSVRRSHRPVARSAATLEWETEEMFMSLFRPLTPR